MITGAGAGAGGVVEDDEDDGDDRYVDNAGDVGVAAGGISHCDAAGARGGDGVSELRHGEGADIAGGKKGLSLSIDTVQGLSPRSSTKVLSPLSRTLKGPE